MLKKCVIGQQQVAAYHRNEFAPKAHQLIEDPRLSGITTRFGVSSLSAIACEQVPTGDKEDGDEEQEEVRMPDLEAGNEEEEDEAKEEVEQLWTEEEEDEDAEENEDPEEAEEVDDEAEEEEEKNRDPQLQEEEEDPTALPPVR